jgi:hypothetical protein
MGVCLVCPDGDNTVPDAELLDHLRVQHPGLYGDGPACWPDGGVVVHDATLTLGDFGSDAA